MATTSTTSTTPSRSLPSGSRFDKPPSRKLVALLAAAGVVTAVVVVLVLLIARRTPSGDPGRLNEPDLTLPADIALPVLVDATAAWGLAGLDLAYDGDQMAGGAAVGDVNGDGTTELVVANGRVAVLQWAGASYGDPRFLAIDNAIGVSISDIDSDGFEDVLIARAGDADFIVWGGTWLADGSDPQRTKLAAAGRSNGLLVGELSGDDLVDIVRLGRSSQQHSPDLLWVAVGDRSFEALELPGPERVTLAGELLDVDDDGLLDIWLTRDVGWARGGDSVLSRRGDPTGGWTDVASELGVALEADGMGITVADLNRDLRIDAYVSDLGDNEVFLGVDGGFDTAFNTGAAHIRPAGALEDVVSSTWGTGAFDANLDGIVDLVLGSGGFPGGEVRNKIDGTEVAIEEPPAVLLGHGDGNFTNVWGSLGIELDIVARGLVVADLDQDGDDDVVIVDRRGSVHVLRNDMTGPTLIVFASPACGNLAGAVVTVETGAGSYQRLLSPHGYASSHGAQIIVGTPAPGSAQVELANPNRDKTAATLNIDTNDRQSVELDCPR